MIFTYILSFTILITSVIKMTDVFITANKELDKKRELFIEKTRKLNNQKGSITLPAALFTVMISALLMFFALKYKVELLEARYRKDSYLCFHYLNIETENYISDMAKFNLTLRSLFAVMLTGAGAAEAKTLFEAAKLARNARHFYYLKNLVSNNYCQEKTASLSFIKNFPFELTPPFNLKTNIDATTILKGHQWTVTHYKNPSGIRLKKSFCLSATYQAEGVILPNLKVKTTEVAMEGFSKLKCLFGSH